MALIGITCNKVEGENRLAAAYVKTVSRFGSVPLLLPVTGSISCWQGWLDTLDGLLLSGGGDPDAVLYGEDAKTSQGEVQPVRDRMEIYLARRALSAGMPLLGICRGMQVLNIAAGGTLYQDLKGVSDLQHIQQAPRSYPIHKIQLSPSSFLHRIMGLTAARVNSFHHQAVKVPGKKVKAAAWSVDGMVEAVEVEGHPFAVGVQWHPEWMAEKQIHVRLFAAFRASAQAYAGKKGMYSRNNI